MAALLKDPAKYKAKGGFARIGVYGCNIDRFHN
jgi:hypothetical protein